MLMCTSLYLSCSRVSCFEGEGEGDAAAKAAAAAAAAAAGEKQFTQDDVNRIMAEDRRKLQTKLGEVEAKLQKALESKTLTENDRRALQENLETVQGQLRTKEQQLQLEKRQLEEAYQQQVAESDKKATAWESLFRDSSIERSLQDAAVKHEAFNSSQIVTQLRPWTRMIEELDPKTNKGTGRYKPVVDMPDVDSTTGEQVIMTRSPEDAVKRMKEMPDLYGNLFKSGVVSGIGAGSATGGHMSGAGGSVDVKKLTPQQYREIRAKNPEWLGLRAKTPQR